MAAVYVCVCVCTNTADDISLQNATDVSPPDRLTHAPFSTLSGQWEEVPLMFVHFSQNPASRYGRLLTAEGFCITLPFLFLITCSVAQCIRARGLLQGLSLVLVAKRVHAL